jgi:hypothetical protein
MVSQVEIYFIVAALGIACIIAAIHAYRKGE